MKFVEIESKTKIVKSLRQTTINEIRVFVSRIFSIVFVFVSRWL